MFWRTMWDTLRVSALALGVVAMYAARTAWAHERSIDKAVVVGASVDQVWDAWTTRGGIQSFFAPEAEIDPRVDGAFHIYFDPSRPAGLRGADTMRFLALQPKQMLSFDWNAPPTLPEARSQRTFVVVRLFPIDAMHTRVTLHHTGWGQGGEWEQAFAYFGNAWTIVLHRLRQRFVGSAADVRR